MGTGTIIALTACVFLTAAALLCAGVAIFAARQARVANLPDVVAVRGVALEARQEANALRAEWKATLGALDAAMEALDDKGQTLQRRRKSAEMAERRRVQGEQQQEEADPMELALRQARAQGLPV